VATVSLGANRSHGSKFTCDSGLIVPIFVDEVLPGDTFNCRLTAFGRLSTPIFPTIHRTKTNNTKYTIQT
jgi:hypothetical protein